MDAQVMGVIDAMLGYTRRSNDTGMEFVLHGRRVTTAVDACNAGADAEFRIPGSGEALIDLGDAMIDLDTFVGDIATRLKAADTGTITLDIAQAAVAERLVIATVLDRAAGDLSLDAIDANFDLIDAIRGGQTDGDISLEDLQKAARDAKDPRVRAAAQWIVDHPDVRRAIDIADDQRGYVSADNRIERKDVEHYMRQRASYQIVMDNFGLFDGANGKPNGKLERKEVEQLANSSTADPAVRRAAQDVLDDDRIFAAKVTGGDGRAGRYDLDGVAKGYAEAQLPLPPNSSGLRSAVCGTAGVFSYVGWYDIGYDLGSGQGKNLVKDIALQAAPKAVEKIGVRVAHKAAAKAVVTGAAKVMGGPVVAGVATGVDLVCRATSGHDWGTLTPPVVNPALPDPAKKVTTDEHPGGVYPSGSTVSPYMDGNGVPVAR